MTRRPRPYYVPVGDEEQVFKAAFRQGLSVLLKGPTGCGKTRFVEAMAHDLDRPLITVACHDDLTTADLVGRYLLQGGETTLGRRPADPGRARGRDLLPRRGRRGAPGHHGGDPPARRPPPPAPDRPARRHRSTPRRGSASSCPTTPATRACSRTSRTRPASAWSPSSSTSRRRTSRRRSSPTRPASTTTSAARLVQLGQAIRRLETAGLREVASTRVLIAAGRLVAEGLPLATAARAAVAGPLTDDPDRDRRPASR